MDFYQGVIFTAQIFYSNSPCGLEIEICQSHVIMR